MIQYLWELPSKVYAYLTNEGIGKEDFVMIDLPRGISSIVAELGVWRAGAAFVLVEDTYAPERIEFIRKDCGCKFVLDIDVWTNIQHLDTKEGYIKPDDHDAAFAVYTSGTTGNPKGVLHEYGNINRILMAKDFKEHSINNPENRFALVAPLNFVASIAIEIDSFYHGIFIYVVAYSTTKNPIAMERFFAKNRINGTFLTPSYLRTLKKKPPMLEYCLTGSEPANGIYVEGIDTHNFYTMSEVGFLIAHFLIDKKYEETPVGKNAFGHEIMLIDEDGNRVTEGKGEICIENRYVRGYINLEDQTKKVFIDGIYHTGDLGKFDKDGNLIICGRLGDMVKINGNRVEPGEIENVAMKVLGLKSAACRIIDNGNRVFICVYYTDNITVDAAKAQKDMQQYLPYYMIPSFFIHLDVYPTTKTGKLDRKNLPTPDFSEYMKDYVAPRTDVEKALCKAFEKALSMQQVGIKDDFYELGGDSMGTIEVIGESGLKGLTATDIFRGHTVEKIAEIYEKNYKNLAEEDPDAINEEQKKKAHPLSTEQIYMVDYQFYTPLSTMFNLGTMLKIDKEIMNLQRLCDAVNATIKNQASLLTTLFFNEDGDMMQKYSPEKFENIQVEKVTESEFEEIKKDLVKPFKIVNSLLVRARVFETEEAGYFFIDVHHTVFDGTSYKIFFTNLFNAYAKRDIIPDYYYYVLYKREQNMMSDFFFESKKYFEDRYEDDTDWVTHISLDNEEARENNLGNVFCQLNIQKNQVLEIEDKYGISPNGFFITVSMLATAIYERKPNIMIGWIHNGRNDANELSTTGLLYRDLPVSIKLSSDNTIKSIYEDVIEQINNGITHSCYPFGEINTPVVTDDAICVLYQDDIRNMDEVSGILGEVELENKYEASENIMDIEILNGKEKGLMLEIDYTSSVYNEKSIERFAKIFIATANVLVSLNNKVDLTIKEIFENISEKSDEDEINIENWQIK